MRFIGSLSFDRIVSFLQPQLDKLQPMERELVLNWEPKDLEFATGKVLKSAD